MPSTLAGRAHDAPPRNARAALRYRAARLFLPSLSDVLFIVLIAILFVSGAGWPLLLTDGDTGWHIRNGEHILATRTVPVSDLFSASGRNAPWYAWEWLADVIFALCHQSAGLKGVALFSGILAGITLVVLFRHMLWRGAAVHVAVAMIILAAASLQFHFLARPHMFTTFLAAVTLWMLDRDNASPDGRIWLLVPITVLWANLHGGFPVLLIALCLYCGAAILRKERKAAIRYGALAAACAAGTLINPYGWNLHVHMWQYLRAEWITQNVSEFQSPVFRDGTMFRFEVLLFLGLACAAALYRRRRYQEIALIIVWAHAALFSARHITIYVIAAAPLIAGEIGRAWDGWSRSKDRKTVTGAVRDLFADMRAPAMRTSFWAPAFVAALAITPGGWPTDFPGNFPTAIFARNAAFLNSGGSRHSAILSSDLWSGYLEYRLYPSRRTFMDGRSDFFGPEMIKDYVCLRSACDRWEQLASKYRFGFALIPPDWPLASAMKRSQQWALKDSDETALLFESKGGV